jgi:hypothetical protein
MNKVPMAPNPWHLSRVNGRLGSRRGFHLGFPDHLALTPARVDPFGYTMVHVTTYHMTVAV